MIGYNKKLHSCNLTSIWHCIVIPADGEITTDNVGQGNFSAELVSTCIEFVEPQQ